MWAYESVFYQIYPLGFTGAPFENDGVQEHRIRKVEAWIPHIKKLGANAVYFSPVFESDTHGYNTRDYKKIDCRLGTNEDFKEVCEKLHKAGIRVVLDGARAESFASRNKPVAAAVDGICQGLGYTLVLLAMSAIRELLGSGALSGNQIFPAEYSASLIVQPVGGFLTLGCLIALMQWIQRKVKGGK